MCDLNVFRVMFYLVTTLSCLLASAQKKERTGGQQCHLWVRLSNANLTVPIDRVIQCLVCDNNTGFDSSTSVFSNCISSQFGTKKGMGRREKGLGSAGVWSALNEPGLQVFAGWLTGSPPTVCVCPWEMGWCRCGDGPGAIHQCHGGVGVYGMCHL